MASREKPKSLDAISLLKDDHAKVKELFSEFKRFQEEKTEGVDELKQDLMDEVCHMLTVHAQIEEEIFYPAARAALPDEDDLMNEADVEHSGAKDLIAQIEDGSASDPMTCARFLVLAEQIDHHVKEEHDEMFPKAKASGMDLDALGRKMQARKDELERDPMSPPATPPKPSLWDRIASYRNNA
jgi:hypothetical protein